MGFAIYIIIYYGVYYRNPHSFYILRHSWICQTHARKQERSKVTWLFTPRNLLHKSGENVRVCIWYSMMYSSLICVVKHALHADGVSFP